MFSQTSDTLLGQLPDEIQEQVKDILARILKLAGYDENSNTDSNSLGDTNFRRLNYGNGNKIIPDLAFLIEV